MGTGTYLGGFSAITIFAHAKTLDFFGKAYFKPFIKAFTENASQKERF
uniref:Uncharacterized protein n=1 Tax=Candidatus Methanophaga sp. ANME-1 ERB7 TaxID=2759913 RepID=A0A7G9ZAS2_9EURY|nr:hypothetical protein DPOOOCMC_00014 [Methanosarcinales archaeon ANME-1 ERB7]